MVIQEVFGDLSLSFFLCSLPSLPCHEVPLLDAARLFGGVFKLPCRVGAESSRQTLFINFE